MDLIIALIGIAISIFCVVTFFMPWINRSKIRVLHARIDLLQTRLKELDDHIIIPAPMHPEPQDNVPENADHDAPSQQDTTLGEAVASHDIAHPQQDITPDTRKDTWKDTWGDEAELAALKSHAEETWEDTPSNDAAAVKPKAGFEQKFGTQLTVWIGAVAMVFSGFYLVKYAIANSILTPELRLGMGGFLGVCLVGAGWVVPHFVSIANNRRIAQALAGAGIAVLYITLYAGVHLYQMISQPVGFTGMAAVTVLAVGLSLAHGQAIAILGLVGGFLTPAVIGSQHPSAVSLFTYLYFVFAGLMMIVRHRNWWMLSMGALGASFLWVITWMEGPHFTNADVTVMGFFLIAVCLTVLLASQKRIEREYKTGRTGYCGTLNLSALIGSMFLMAALTNVGEYAFTGWAMFGLISVGTIALALIRPALYHVMPPIAMGLNMLLIAMWDHPSEVQVAYTIVSFGMIFLLPSYILMWRESDRVQNRMQNRMTADMTWVGMTWADMTWAGMAAAGSALYYLIGYAHLYNAPLTQDIPYFWSILALALAALNGGVLALAYKKFDPRKVQTLFSIFTFAGVGFTTAAIFLDIPDGYVALLICAEIVAISYLNLKVEIKALRAACVILFMLLIIPMFDHITLFGQIALFALSEVHIGRQTLPHILHLKTELVLPAILLGGASMLLKRQRGGVLVDALQVAACAIIFLLSSYLIRTLIWPDMIFLNTEASFTQRGIITNLMLLGAFGALLLSRKTTLAGLTYVGSALAMATIWRLAFFDMMAKNPLFENQEIGGVLVFNSLILPYLLPIFWLGAMRLTWPNLFSEKLMKLITALPLLLGFIWVSLNVRFFHQGPILNGPIFTDSEIYTYSAIWLLMGIGLLIGGIARSSKELRIASLVVILLVVSKVFLYDASALEGLYRVISFFGLGLSLMGLSFFYSKYVFIQEDQTLEDQQEAENVTT